MKFISESLTRSIGDAVLNTKEKSPHLFFAAGVAGIIGGTYLACKATLKVEPVLDEIKEDLENVKALHNDPAPDSTYSEKEYRKDMVYVYGRSAVKLGRLYGPAAIVGAVSIAALTGSHVQLARRNAALGATVTALTQAFSEYRVRVQEELGEERERDIYFGVHEEEVVNEDGSVTLKTVAGLEGISPYARFFDPCSDKWQKSEELNRMYVQGQQNYANQILKTRGHLFLNEVYDSLGLERSSIGQMVGWIYNGDGDNYVDFGMFEVHNQRFVNQLERSVLLDFNVDGVIYDKI